MAGMSGERGADGSRQGQCQVCVSGEGGRVLMGVDKANVRYVCLGRERGDDGRRQGQ